MSWRSPAGRGLSVLFGPTVWALHFIVVYAAESLLCRTAGGHGHGVLLASATVLAIVALAFHTRWEGRRLGEEGTARFLAGVAIALDGLSGIALLFVAGAGLALPACTGAMT